MEGVNEMIEFRLCNCAILGPSGTSKDKQNRWKSDVAS